MFGWLRATMLSLVVLALVALLASCTAAPAPTPTAAPPSKPAATVPTSPAPTAASAAAPSPTAVPAPTKAAVPTPTPTPTPSGGVTLQWFGQSTFLLTSSQGTKLLMDPAAPSTGYAVQPISGVDVVLVSHEHADHNHVALAPGSPVILRGLKDGDWAKIDQQVKDLKVRSVSSYHDAEQGTKRGKNALFVIEVDGLRIAHLGDLGHALSQEQATALGKPDVLIVPVGGFYTIDAAEATRLAAQLSPKIVVPMHYKTPKMRADWPGGPVDPFLEGKKVEKIGSNKISISRDKLPAAMVVYTLGYES